MLSQNTAGFNLISEAFKDLPTNFRNNSSLEETAGKIHLNPFFFQKIFTEWAGVSFQEFLVNISVEHTKKALKEGQSAMLKAEGTEASEAYRLHSRFITIESMTSDECKNQGENLEIHYSFEEGPFGKMIVASTHKGVCSIGFANDETSTVNDLRKKFPKAIFKNKAEASHSILLSAFTDDWSSLHSIKLHLKGTNFQLKVWNALLNIPMGKLVTYGDIAKHINHPKACRAVGSAVGDNPVFFLIPCHRVIQASGKIGNYYWGRPIKTAIIGWESVKMAKK